MGNAFFRWSNPLESYLLTARGDPKELDTLENLIYNPSTLPATKSALSHLHACIQMLSDPTLSETEEYRVQVMIRDDLQKLRYAYCVRPNANQKPHVN